MSAAALATARLCVEEGYRPFIYKDSQGHNTIGYGLNLDAGMSRECAAAALNLIVADLDKQLLAYDWYASLDPVRQSVFIDVAYNCGLPGLLHFVQCINAARAKDWQGAHDQLLDSSAARLNVGRYQHLAQVLLTGLET